MAPDRSLFRPEVIDAGEKFPLGKIVLFYRVTNFFILVLALVLLIAFCLFIGIGQYTRRANVNGVLQPEHGIIGLYASQSGRLVTLNTREGQQVRAGDVLLTFESEHVGANGQTVEAAVSEQLRAQIDTLHKELNGTLQLHEFADDAQRRQLATSRGNRETLFNGVETQKKRVRSAEETVSRFEQLQKSGFLPTIQVQQKIDELMDQQQRLQTMQQALASADADITRQESEIANNPLKKQVAKAQIERNIFSMESELSKQRSNHEWSVVAPCDGVVSSLAIARHQVAVTGVQLVSIVPSKATLQATLYAASRDLGFIQIGQRVQIKLDAFPYQKFGLVEGRVIAIADSPINILEASSIDRLATSRDATEPLYIVRVALKKQYMDAYGKKMKLRPGMQLSAQIELDTRFLYEWLIEPLIGLRQSL